jgi:hypothetical protein
MRGNRFFVLRRKLTKHLLNPNPKAGRAEARFLLSKGFSPKDPATLEQALIQHAREAAVCQIRPRAEGKGYKLPRPPAHAHGPCAQVHERVP